MATERDTSPEWAEKAREKRKAYLAEKIKCEKAIKVITGRKKGEDARYWWKRFWAVKAKREGKSETWLEAKLLTYRNPKKEITLAEVEGLQEEFRQLSGYRGQGSVLRKGDLRLLENKKKKLEKAQKAAESQTRRRARQPSENPFWDPTEAKRTAAGKRSAKP